MSDCERDGARGASGTGAAHEGEVGGAGRAPRVP